MSDLVHFINANGGYLMRAQLLELGYSDPMIRTLVRDRILKRLRHGTYVSLAAWTSSSESERHRVLVRSVLDKLGPGVAASHHSAAAIHGFDLHGADLDEVHLVRLDRGSGRREAGVAHHHGTITDDDVVEVDGMLTVTAARAVFDTCTASTVESGMVVASSALHSGKVDRDHLIDEGMRHPHWLGVRNARLAIALSDGRLESVGETRSLHMMWRHHVPNPELQVVIHDRDGKEVARTDFAWLDARHVGEFDGLVKYGRLNPFAHDVGQVLVLEKRREDLVRDLDHGFSRWIWADLGDERQAALAIRIQQGIERSRRLFTRNATHIA